MINRRDTQMGGPQRRFATTCWTMIVNSQNSPQELKKAIMDELYRKYWKPVYWYLLRKDYPPEKAKDLTQGFFTEIVWGRDFIQSADRQKGRFRNFLLTALERYLKDTWRYEHAQKRMPVQEIFSCDLDDGFEPADDGDAEQAFHSAWLMELLTRSFEAVRLDMTDSGMEQYWSLFEQRCLHPILTACRPPSLSDLCESLHVENVEKAGNMITTVKRRVKKTILQELENQSGADADTAEEMAELLNKIMK